MVCSWCQDTPAGALVSHGICAKCEKKLLAELEPAPVAARLRPEPFESRGGTYYGHYGV